MDMKTLVLKNNLPIKGKGPCSDLSISKLGHLGAIFKTSTNNYAKVFDIKTGRSISGDLNNGTTVDRISFSTDGSQIISWPEEPFNLDNLNTGISSIWDVAISDGENSSKGLSKIFTAFGGKKLSLDGIPIPDNSVSEIGQLVSKIDKTSKIGQFYNWLKEFPGTRNTSPFRENPSDNYFKELLKQNDLNLLNEATRINPNNPHALAKSAIYSLINSKTKLCA